jgi:hypothetical protein
LLSDEEKLKIRRENMAKAIEAKKQKNDITRTLKEKKKELTQIELERQKKELEEIQRQIELKQQIKAKPVKKVVKQIIEEDDEESEPEEQIIVRRKKKPVSVPADRGRWMQLVFRVVASTTPSSDDGILQMWRRWENESSFTQFHNLNNLPFRIGSGEPDGWHNGYLMGWANAAYPEDTQWMLDDFTVSTTSLISSDTDPPTLSALGPSGEYAKFTYSLDMEVETDEVATCRYSHGAATTWANMTAFGTTGGTSHSETTATWPGLLRQSCYKCQDAELNESAASCTTYWVEPEPKQPVRH